MRSSILFVTLITMTIIAVLAAPGRSQAGPLPGAAPDFEKVRFASLGRDPASGGARMIDGYFARPAGAGPFPAVIALHGCSGLFGKSGLGAREQDWAKRFLKAGYAVLFPDSFTPRGFKEICTRREVAEMPFRERPLDAYGALLWLQAQPGISRERVILFGWSNGGSAVLSAIDKSSKARPANLKDDFAAAIAFYPGCWAINKNTRWATKIPLTILMGAEDDWTLAKYCVVLAERARRDSSVEIITYAGAHHGFDAPATPVHYRHGVWSARGGTVTVGTDPRAREDSIRKVGEILDRFADKKEAPAKR